MKTLQDTYKDIYESIFDNITPGTDCACTNIFAIIKPEFLEHAQDIINMFKNEGWNLHKTKTKQLTQSEAQELYKVHKDKDFYDDLCKYMSSGPSMGLIFKLNYCADYKKIFADIGELKDNIRNKWGIDDCKNVLHSSDSLSAIERESKIYF